jgi:hypothetical protein
MTIRIVISVLFLTVISCGVLVKPKRTFEIENKTSQDLNLRVFGDSKLLNDIYIESQSKFDTTIVQYSVAGNDKSTPFNIEKVDSIVVIFNTNRIIKYYCDGRLLYGVSSTDSCIIDGKSPMYFSYKNSKKNIKTMNFVYEESDYESANTF